MSYKSALLLAGPLLATAVFALGCTRQVSFEHDVRNVLRERCVGCHKEGGVGYIQSGLNLENYDGLMRGTKFGPVIKSGSSADSTLVILIEHKAHSTINMPRGQEPLPENQVALIKHWVDQGAKNN